MNEIHSSRVRRLASNYLFIVGGIILAYPLWSGGYAHWQQSRLGDQLAHASRSFATIASDESARLAKSSRAERMRHLAHEYAARLDTGGPVGRIRIPSIGVSYVILEGRHKSVPLDGGPDGDLLRRGPVHYGLTPLPGAGRPFAVAGHRTTFLAPFYRLNRLRAGDAITVATPYGTFAYGVVKLTLVKPGDTSVLLDRGYDLVLTTCNPIGRSSQRLVVWAKLKSVSFR